MEAYSKQFIIPGDPIALSRGRYSRGKVYDSQKHLKLILGVHIRNQFDDCRMFQGPLKLEFRFYFAPSPSWSANKKKQMLENEWMIYVPDVSNLIKMYEDVCNGIIFKDDCAICCLTAEKKWDINPRTEFIVTEQR